MQQIKRVSIMMLSMILLALSASMTIKAAIGLAAWDAIAQSLSHLSMIRVGTVGMILNILCVLGQILLLKKHFPLRQLLQIPVSILIGLLINYFYYTLLASFVLPNYAVTLVIFLLGTVLASLAVSVVMVLNIVTFPLEAFCMALAQKTGYRFSILRQAADILAVLLTIILAFSLEIPMTAREGTVIGMLLFAPLLGVFIKLFTPLIEQSKNEVARH
ncbi:YitT family protein [Marinilactibacillus sp. GCM10026970]|uniref:YczE/YyaS/YitT family protein n=1 Tax=Marinilactibacillus sp. GCM10026970 TaxID=3252642 RepID=UPI00361ECDCD